MTITDKIMDLSTLWKQAAVVFPYFDQRKIDWDETYRIYLEKVMQTKTDREYYLLLAEFFRRESFHLYEWSKYQLYSKIFCNPIIR